jgi:hypothetical protein
MLFRLRSAGQAGHDGDRLNDFVRQHLRYSSAAAPGLIVDNGEVKAPCLYYVRE